MKSSHGYQAFTDRPKEIANITFAWMVEQVSPFLAFDRTSFYQAMNEREKLLRAIENERVSPSGTQQALQAVQGWVWSLPPELPLRKVHRGWATGLIVPEEGMTSYPGVADRSPLSTVGTRMSRSTRRSLIEPRQDQMVSSTSLRH